MAMDESKSLFRSVASKAFWNNRSIWYEIPKEWNYTLEDVNFRRFRLDLEFAKYITQVSVEMIDIYLPMEATIEISQLIDLESAMFWNGFTKCFPMVNRIIFRQPVWVPSLDPETKKIFDLVRSILKAAPCGILAMVEFYGLIREIWQLDSLQVDLQKDYDAAMPTMVTPPARQYSKGPICDYEWFKQADRLAHLDTFGIKDLVLQSHQLSEQQVMGMKCPNTKKGSRCGALCEQQWALKKWWSDQPDCPSVAASVIGKFPRPRLGNILHIKRTRCQKYRKLRQELKEKIESQLGEPGGSTRADFWRLFDAHLIEEFYQGGVCDSEEDGEFQRDYLLMDFQDNFDIADHPLEEEYRDMIAEAEAEPTDDDCSENEDCEDWAHEDYEEMIIGIKELHNRRKERHDSFWNKAGFFTLKQRYNQFWTNAGFKVPPA